MSNLLAGAVIAGASIAFAVYLVIVERRRLEAAAQRFRELRDEGIDDVPRPDFVPEFAPRRATMRLADGTDVDRDALLRQELSELRRYERERDRISRPFGRGRRNSGTSAADPR